MSNILLRFREIDRDKFTAIKDGRKSIETRAATAKYANVKSGDTLTLVCGKDKAAKSVSEVQHFESIKDMLAVYDIGRILPGVTTLDEAERVYYSFPDYKEKINKYGIIVLVLDQ